MDGEKNNLENEAEIVERAKTDNEAFAVLYNFYFPRIYGYIFKRLGSREASEDILSTTFMRAFVNLKKYQSRGFSFGAWLYRIATNNLMDHYRRTKGIVQESLEAAEASHFSENEQPLELARHQDRAAIEKTLIKLPDRYREIINLRFFAELEISEIAAVLQISNTHASVLIHRALKCFKDKFKE